MKKKYFFRVCVIVADVQGVMMQPPRDVYGTFTANLIDGGVDDRPRGGCIVSTPRRMYMPLSHPIRPTAE